ncbi:DUF6491 family protein [Brevundimonas sp. DWR2-3-1b1]|uniref:DUF6491 family protein n=1 Tax=unclassified Brevundimonas TaxID=2622653 RepID=UPI003CF27DE3
MHRLILSSAAVLALWACAPSPGATTASRVDAAQCFRPSLVRNFNAPNDQTLYVRTSGADVFQIDSTFCRDMTRALSVALEPLSGSNLCVGDQATLRSPTTGPEPCRVRIARKLTVEEVAALPSRDRP